MMDYNNSRQHSLETQEMIMNEWRKPSWSFPIFDLNFQALNMNIHPCPEAWSDLEIAMIFKIWIIMQ